jgi:threonyl-tRNA synthetase
VVGKKEAENQSVALRTLGGADQEILALEDAIVKIATDSTPPLA